MTNAEDSAANCAPGLGLFGGESRSPDASSALPRPAQARVQMSIGHGASRRSACRGLRKLWSLRKGHRCQKGHHCRKCRARARGATSLHGRGAASDAAPGYFAAPSLGEDQTPSGAASEERAACREHNPTCLGKPRVYNAITFTHGSNHTEQLDDAEVFVNTPVSARRHVQLDREASRRRSLPSECQAALDSGLDEKNVEGAVDAGDQLSAGVLRRASEQIMIVQLKQLAAKQKLRYSLKAQRQRVIEEAVKFTELYCRTVSILEACFTLRPPLRRHSDCFIQDMTAMLLA